MKKEDSGFPSSPAGTCGDKASSAEVAAKTPAKKQPREGTGKKAEQERKVRPIKKVRREESSVASGEKLIKRRRTAPSSGSVALSAAAALTDEVASATTTAADDLCSAPDCVRPQGEAVNWVQCDGGCEQWFHLLCVGLSMNEVKDSEDYYCPQCNPVTPKGKAANGEGCEAEDDEEEEEGTTEAVQESFQEEEEQEEEEGQQEEDVPLGHATLETVSRANGDSPSELVQAAL